MTDPWMHDWASKQAAAGMAAAIPAAAGVAASGLYSTWVNYRKPPPPLTEPLEHLRNVGHRRPERYAGEQREWQNESARAQHRYTEDLEIKNKTRFIESLAHLRELENRRPERYPGEHKEWAAQVERARRQYTEDFFQNNEQALKAYWKNQVYANFVDECTIYNLRPEDRLSDRIRSYNLLEWLDIEFFSDILFKFSSCLSMDDAKKKIREFIIFFKKTCLKEIQEEAGRRRIRWNAHNS